MKRTLPLFEGLEAPRPLPEQPRQGVSVAPAGSAPAADGRDRHLRAAWRLSRGMWRYPDHSPEQTRAGLAICRHLQALLAEADADGSGGRR